VNVIVNVATGLLSTPRADRVLAAIPSHRSPTTEPRGRKTRDIFTNQGVDETKTTRRMIRNPPPRKTANAGFIQSIRLIYSMSLGFMALMDVSFPTHGF
jgi:hypothetical protein